MPEIGLYVPTRGHVWHETASALGPFNPIYVFNTTGVSDARESIVARFLVSDAQILVMCDDDVVPNTGWEQIVSDVEKGRTDVCAAVVPILLEGSVVLPNVFERDDDLPRGFKLSTDFIVAEGLQEVDAVGTGLMAIHRRVLEDRRMSGCFRADFNVGAGEDLLFCQRAKKARYKVCANFDVWCDHRINASAISLANAYMEVVNRAVAPEEG